MRTATNPIELEASPLAAYCGKPPLSAAILGASRGMLLAVQSLVSIANLRQHCIVRLIRDRSKDRATVKHCGRGEYNCVRDDRPAGTYVSRRKQASATCPGSYVCVGSSKGKNRGS